VRHGETVMNKNQQRQGEEGRLSELGIKEVEELSKRLVNMHIKKMFISPFERTRETAEIINGFLNLEMKDITMTYLLAERKNPTCIIGKNYNDPMAKTFVDTMDKSVHDPNLRMYDEENFQDLKNRAIIAKDYLAKNGTTRNLCVTHGIFLKMFLSILLYDKALSVKQYIEMSLYNPADNAGVTLVKYSPAKIIFKPLLKFWDFIVGESEDEELEEEIKKNKLDKYSPWEILAYNDYTRDGFKKLRI
jgi:broad specificity phosphatase PhoE